jgi:hypothetical protein
VYLLVAETHARRDSTDAKGFSDIQRREKVLRLSNI